MNATATATPARRRRRRTFPVVVTRVAPREVPDLKAAGPARRRAVFAPGAESVGK